MRRFFIKLALEATLLTVIAGCDGGSSGTGISTAALGNVASVRTALRPTLERSRPTMVARWLGWLRLEHEALARGPLEDIRISIEGTTLSTQTDAQGHFVVNGNFAGPVSMIFELPDGGRANLVIVVPRGGEVTLTNVRLDGRTGQATADSQRVRFAGLVHGTDCPQGSALMVSRATPTDGNTYTVLLDSATVRDQSGNSLACVNLSAGQSANVDGDVQGDGDVQAQSVEVESESIGGGNSGPGSGGANSSEHEGGSGSEDGSGGEGSGEGGGKGGSGGEGGESSSGEGGGSSSGEGSRHS